MVHFVRVILATKTSTDRSLQLEVLGLELFKFKNAVSSALSLLKGFVEQGFKFDDDFLLLFDSVLVKSHFLHFFANLSEGLPQFIVLHCQLLEVSCNSLGLCKVHVGTLESFLEVLVANALGAVRLSQLDDLVLQFLDAHARNFLRNEIRQLRCLLGSQVLTQDSVLTLHHFERASQIDDLAGGQLERLIFVVVLAHHPMNDLLLLC